MSNPQPTRQPLPPSQNKDSLLAGFLLGWAAILAGFAANVLFWSAQAWLGLPDSGIFFVGIGSLPLLAVISLVIWFASRGKPRATRGALLAFGSLVALVLLLVAACFGLIVFSGGLGHMR